MQVKVQLKVCKSQNHLYLVVGNKEYYLFSQKYKKTVVDYYSKGVVLEKAMDFSRSKRNKGITKIMEKLPAYVRNIEREYDIHVLKGGVTKKAA